MDLTVEGADWAVPCVAVTGQVPNDCWSASDTWLPPEVAAALVEYGHVQTARLHAEGGDWHCARALTQALVTRDEADAAVAVLRPFVDHGHWKAVESLADILDKHGRPDEAIALVRRHLTAGGPYGATTLAELLARRGRIDEVIELLGPHVGDFRYAEVLVTLTAGTGHDDEIASLLRDRIDAEQHQAGHWPHLPCGTDMVLAVVLERQGRVDDAVALLQARIRSGEPLANHVDQLADILARHDRETELRTLAALPVGKDAAYRLAVWLEEQGRFDDAVTVLRPLTHAGSPNAATVLATLLARHGQVGEAAEVLRRALITTPDSEWILELLCEVLTSQGRPQDALAAIDDFAAHHGGMWPELRLLRSRVLVTCGHIEEAITELRADPDSGAGCVTTQLADLLAAAGRPEEAIAVLRSGRRADPWSTVQAAMLLIQGGHVAEALEPFRTESAARRAAKAAEDNAFWQQFRAGRQPGHPAPTN